MGKWVCFVLAMTITALTCRVNYRLTSQCWRVWQGESRNALHVINLIIPRYWLANTIMRFDTSIHFTSHTVADRESGVRAREFGFYRSPNSINSFIRKDDSIEFPSSKLPKRFLCLAGIFWSQLPLSPSLSISLSCSPGLFDPRHTLFIYWTDWDWNRI